MSSREELTARYRSTVQTLAGIAANEGLTFARELAHHIVMNQIAAEASRQQDVLYEIHDSERDRR